MSSVATNVMPTTEEKQTIEAKANPVTTAKASKPAKPAAAKKKPKDHPWKGLKVGILGPCIYQESDARTIYFPDEADTSQRLFKRMNAECKGKSISQQVDVVILGDTTRMPNGDENKTLKRALEARDDQARKKPLTVVNFDEFIEEHVKPYGFEVTLHKCLSSIEFGKIEAKETVPKVGERDATSLNSIINRAKKGWVVKFSKDKHYVEAPEDTARRILETEDMEVEEAPAAGDDAPAADEGAPASGGDATEGAAADDEDDVAADANDEEAANDESAEESDAAEA